MYKVFIFSIYKFLNHTFSMKNKSAGTLHAKTLLFIALLSFCFFRGISQKVDTLHLIYHHTQNKAHDTTLKHIDRWIKSLNGTHMDITVVGYYPSTNFKPFAQERVDEMFLILNRKGRELFTFGEFVSKKGKDYQRTTVDIIYTPTGSAAAAAAAEAQKKAAEAAAKEEEKKIKDAAKAAENAEEKKKKDAEKAANAEKKAAEEALKAEEKKKKEEEKATSKPEKSNDPKADEKAKKEAEKAAAADKKAGEVAAKAEEKRRKEEEKAAVEAEKKAKKEAEKKK